jgi:hypothetical protein
MLDNGRVKYDPLEEDDIPDPQSPYRPRHGRQGKRKLWSIILWVEVANLLVLTILYAAWHVVKKSAAQGRSSGHPGVVLILNFDKPTQMTAPWTSTQRLPSQSTSPIYHSHSAEVLGTATGSQSHSIATMASCHSLCRIPLRTISHNLLSRPKRAKRFSKSTSSTSYTVSNVCAMTLPDSRTYANSTQIGRKNTHTRDTHCTA